MELSFYAGEDVRKYIRDNFNKDNNEAVQKVIKFLQENGFSQMQTVFLLIKEGNVPFTAANSFVLNSDTWNK